MPTNDPHESPVLHMSLVSTFKPKEEPGSSSVSARSIPVCQDAHTAIPSKNARCLMTNSSQLMERKSSFMTIRS